MGRTARRGYDLSQVEIVPSRRTRSSKEVSTTWQLDAYRFDIPLVTHPTDAVVSPANAVRVGKLGGLGVLNAEGLWARHADAEGALARVVEAAASDDPDAAVCILQELHAAPIRDDLLTEALRTVRDAGVTVAARVSPQRARELAPLLLAAGVEVLVVQGTIISAEHVSTGEPLNLKDFIASLEIPVVAGGVGDYRTAMHLMRTGAAGVIVGYGESSATTTDAVLGIGVPMATAIVDAAAARRDYLDETGGRYVHVIADGGMDHSRRPGQGDRLRGGRRDARRAAHGGRGRARPRPVLDLRGRAPVPAPLGGDGLRRPGGAGPGDGAVRPVEHPERHRRPVRGPAPGDGEDGLLGPQGVPACGAHGPRLSRPP